VLTLMLSFLLFVLAPMQAAGVVTGQHFGYFFGLVLLPAGLLYSRNILVAAPIAIAIALVVTAALMDFERSPRTDLHLDSAAWLISGLALSVVVARAVFAPGRVTYHRVVGAVLLYLIIGLIFVALYGFVALETPKAFANLPELHGDFAIAGNLIYFSFVTLTTTGYGDIAPLHPYARSLANVEAIIGQIYPATLLARLVTLELAHGGGS
jgi:Ion channel